MGKKTLGSLLLANTIEDPFGASAIFNPMYPAIQEVEELAESLLSPLNVSQSVFMQQYNWHRERVQLSQVKEGGWCHGLTLTWLKYAARNQQKEFFNLYNEVVRGLETTAMNSEKIEEFYTEIDKAQHPWEYYPNTNQESIDVILGVPTIITWFDPEGEGFTARKWQNILTKIMAEYEMIRISAYNKGKSHTIGMFRDKEGTYLFDCNGKSKIVTLFKQFSSLQAINWIKSNLYTQLGLQIDQSTPMKLTITGVKSSLFLENDRQNLSTSPTLFPRMTQGTEKALPSNNRKRKRELTEGNPTSMPTAHSPLRDLSLFNPRPSKKPYYNDVPTTKCSI
ncbi:hypothetical protein [Legionella sp.]|uniref:hypothetical protein n=1 Tax=Legionella sp. TaxID=459 RepID=UPI0032208316